MAWNIKPIEIEMEKLLIEQLGENDGKAKYARYITARNFLCAQTYRYIQSEGEKGLTDHSEEHIANVLSNAWRLLPEKNNDQTVYTGVDLYFLALSILFHDVGNIFGRDNHQKRISEAYSSALTMDSRFRSERIILQDIVASHCGEAIDGSQDTIRCLESKTGAVDGHPVNIQDIAAILRLADELAEGPQRTSDFLIKHCGLPTESEIYHQYAQCVDPFIDRNNERLVIKYHLLIKEPSEKNTKQLNELIKFIIQRIEKMNDERRYCRYYSELLQPFKRLEVSINLSEDNEYERKISSIQLPPITDRVVPKSDYGTLAKHYPEYQESALCAQIDVAIKRAEETTDA